MSTPAVYTFKGDSRQGQTDVHLVYHSDGYPSGAADIIPDLAEVVCRIWNGDNVDFAALDLPRVSEVSRRANLDESNPSTPFRYEVEMVNGRPVAVKALRHQPVISEELKLRLQSARTALEQVEREMQAALDVPTYIEIGNGKLNAIRKLGRGYEDEQ
jgi:hypothetical protein